MFGFVFTLHLSIKLFNSKNYASQNPHLFFLVIEVGFGMTEVSFRTLLTASTIFLKL